MLDSRTKDIFTKQAHETVTPAVNDTMRRMLIFVPVDL
jgi:hypothetical protein